jgi:hypothetical protein
MVRLVIENGQFLNPAHDFTEVGLAVGGPAYVMWAKGFQEAIAKVIAIKRGFAHVAEIDTMYMREKQIPGVAEVADVILNTGRPSATCQSGRSEVLNLRERKPPSRAKASCHQPSMTAAVNLKIGMWARLRPMASNTGFWNRKRYGLTNSWQ